MNLTASRRFYGLAAMTACCLSSVSLQAHELPVGDGKISTSAKAGSVYACDTSFKGGGGQGVGDWFHGQTWDPAQKPHVAGKVFWPHATYKMSDQGDAIMIEGNSLPVGEPTGIFPVSPDDPAYQFDSNPNAITEIPLTFSIPSKPAAAGSPGCLPMGIIAVTTTGVAIFNALDAEGRDAAAHEVQDLCDGHPEVEGQYHYHSASRCLPGADQNAVVGWAKDGFPILGMRDASGQQLHNADLDACHGRREQVTVDGRTYDYAYRMTEEYPYTLGCYTGDVGQDARFKETLAELPTEAVAACATLSPGQACDFTGLWGATVTGSCGTPPGMDSRINICVP